MLISGRPTLTHYAVEYRVPYGRLHNRIIKQRQSRMTRAPTNRKLTSVQEQSLVQHVKMLQQQQSSSPSSSSSTSSRETSHKRILGITLVEMDVVANMLLAIGAPAGEKPLTVTIGWSRRFVERTPQLHMMQQPDGSSRIQYDTSIQSDEEVDAAAGDTSARSDRSLDMDYPAYDRQRMNVFLDQLRNGVVDANLKRQAEIAVGIANAQPASTSTHATSAPPLPTAAPAPAPGTPSARRTATAYTTPRSVRSLARMGEQLIGGNTSPSLIAKHVKGSMILANAALLVNASAPDPAAGEVGKGSGSAKHALGAQDGIAGREDGAAQKRRRADI
jgi:hypothetical protein